ncbi:hypothetical protein MBLNU459_g1109t1 [Dothideomycetes sp. NU459]
MSSTAHVLSIGACILSALAPCVTAQTYSYTLQNVYAGNSFYDGFNFYSGPDPTNGFVQYVDQPTANSSGLIGFGSGGTAKWGVDDTNVISNTSSGRLSVRLESNTNYNHGLFLADIKHMPGSICGVWPAFWTLGDATWPAHGEVDIIEGVNAGTSNQVSAHTAPNCTMSYTGQTATALTTDCSLATGGATGCQSGMYEGDNNYGTPFNSNGGGVYAMQWTSAFIKVWFFPRNNIPASITAGAPNVNAFGTPNVNMDGGSCDIDSHFVNHRLIFDTTFCGDWAGAVYSSSSCPLAGVLGGQFNPDLSGVLFGEFIVELFIDGFDTVNFHFDHDLIAQFLCYHNKLDFRHFLDIYHLVSCEFDCLYKQYISKTNNDLERAYVERHHLKVLNFDVVVGCVIDIFRLEYFNQDNLDCLFPELFD